MSQLTRERQLQGVAVEIADTVMTHDEDNYVSVKEAAKPISPACGRIAYFAQPNKHLSLLLSLKMLSKKSPIS